MEAPTMSPIARGAFAACIIIPLLAVVTMLLRVKARWLSQAKLASDDWTMVFALIISIGACSILAYALFLGAAMGSEDAIKNKPVILTYELDMIIEQLYGIAEALVKISILLFYKRIFCIGRFPLIVHLSIGLVSIWALLFLLLFIFPVWPISTTWVPNQAYHQNYDWTKVLLWHAITNIGLDLYVLCLPLPIIRTLHMSKGRKAAVASILGLGLFCVVASCIRLSYVVGVQKEEVDTAGTGSDAVSLAALWCVIEPCCSVIAGCLPTLGPLLKGTEAGKWMGKKMRKLFPSYKEVEFVGQTFIDSDRSGSWGRNASGVRKWSINWLRKGDGSSRQDSAKTDWNEKTSGEGKPKLHTGDEAC